MYFSHVSGRSLTHHLVENQSSGGWFVACGALVRRISTSKSVFFLSTREGNSPFCDTCVTVNVTSLHHLTSPSVLQSLLVCQGSPPSRIHPSQAFPEFPYLTIHDIRKTVVIDANKLPRYKEKPLSATRVFLQMARISKDLSNHLSRMMADGRQLYPSLVKTRWLRSNWDGQSIKVVKIGGYIPGHPVATQKDLLGERACKVLCTVPPESF